MASTRLASDQVWQALDEASYAVVAFVGADGQPRSSGVVYAVVDRRIYVVTAADSMKARQLQDGQTLAVTVPVRRGGVLSLLFPIPPASVSFRARVTVHAPGSVDIESLSRRLARMLPEQRKEGVVLELEPVGTFLAYGIGVSLREMVDPARSLAHVPVEADLGR